MDFAVNCRFERKKGWKLPRLMKRKHSWSAVSSPAVHTVSYRRRWNVNNLLAWLTSHHLLIQRAHVLWFLKNHLTCIHRFLICDLGGVVGKASLRLNCEQLRSVNASSGKTKAQLPRPSPTLPHPFHQWYHGWWRQWAEGGKLHWEVFRGKWRFREVTLCSVSLEHVMFILGLSDLCTMRADSASRCKQKTVPRFATPTDATTTTTTSTKKQSEKQAKLA